MTQEDPPIDIQGVIQRARQAITDDPDHNLRPFYRSLVYSLLGPLDEEKTRLRRGRLAIMVVEKVLPIWENEWPGDNRPHNLLARARDALAGSTSKEENYSLANSAFDQMAEWIQSLGEANASRKTMFASNVLAASVECIFEASGSYTFGGTDPNSTEADLDPWTMDTAGWAVSAYAGPWYDAASDTEKRREFWMWWIGEAVPLVLAE